MPKLNTIDIAGTAMSKLTTMNYAGISQSLYNQFCTKPEFTCNEQWMFCFVSYIQKKIYWIIVMDEVSVFHCVWGGW